MFNKDDYFTGIIESLINKEYISKDNLIKGLYHYLP